MSRERGDFDRYFEESRTKAFATIGEMEARGFNCRALKKHIEEVDLSNFQGRHLSNGDDLLPDGDNMLGKFSQSG